MKKYKLVFSFIFSLLFFSAGSHGQTIKFFGHVLGQIEPVDTVTFGFANNATMGIDQALGEIDITDVPIDTYDIRVIQRTAEDFECLYNENAEAVHFSTSFESKNNLRPSFTSSEDDNSLYFEVISYSNNFDGGYSIILVDYVRNLQDPIDQYFMGLSAVSECSESNNMFLDTNVFDGSPFPLAALLLLPTPLGSDDLYTHFYFKLERDITTSTNEPILSPYKIYPNPADEFVNLQGYQPEDSAYELYNIQGQLVKQGYLSTTQTKINTTDLPAGSYIVKILSNNGQVASRSLLSIY